MLDGPEPGPDATMFRVRSAAAERVELCLFDASGGAEQRLDMARDTAGSWQLPVPGIRPGQLYGFRAHGPWEPRAGQRFNPHKLLLDPYARAVNGPINWHPSLLDHRADRPELPDESDSAPHLPRCVVVSPEFDWRGDIPARTPLADSLIYECHVRGMTIQHPDVAPEERGRFLGLASEPVIRHLAGLGVTAVELLPVAQSAGDARLARLGLTNYWGYSTAAFLAPDARFASAARGEQVREFKEMVRRLHAAGIEVVLDVVFNHSAEADPGGPTVSFRGLGNADWYLAGDSPDRYLDVTGCGNTLDVRAGPGHRLLYDALRYWVAEMHVDGFRFDLAPALARGRDFPASLDPFFSALRADPVLAPCKLIAEPWDLGPDGYQLGRFPAGWSEWNDRYRDTVRRFWSGMPGQTGALATALAGSSDLFGGVGRDPQASVNFVTCHDGFTLQDLVQYAGRHNEANGEGGEDGHPENWSRNWGVEGPSPDPAVLRLRERAARAMLLSLFVSQGLPMLSQGDELGRTQQGNNNAYALDNPVSWVDWNLDDARRGRLRFAQDASALRRRHPVLRRSQFFTPTDAVWLRPDGSPMKAADWEAPDQRAFMLALRERAGTDLLLAFNGGAAPVDLTLPEGNWRLALSSAEQGAVLPAHGRCRLPAVTLAVLEPATSSEEIPS